MRISITEVQDWLQCRLRWNWASDNAEALVPRDPAPALFFGTGIHEGLEELLNGKDPVAAFEKWFWTEMKLVRQRAPNLSMESEQMLLGHLPLGKGMLDHYRQYYIKEPFTVLETEAKFEVPIPGTGGRGFLVGRRDGRIQDDAGRKWVMEHKSYADLPPEGFLILDIQTTGYVWADSKLYPNDRTVGFLYNGLKKKLPSIPAVLKSGAGLSRAQIETTAEVYEAACRQHGFEPADYRDMLSALKAKGNTFFKREFVPRSNDELAFFEEYLTLVHNEMEKRVIYHNPTWDCMWWCPYKDPCILRANRGDFQQVLNLRYIKSDKPRYPTNLEYVKPHVAAT